MDLLSSVLRLPRYLDRSLVNDSLPPNSLVFEQWMFIANPDFDGCPFTGSGRETALDVRPVSYWSIPLFDMYREWQCIKAYNAYKKV